MNQNLSHVNRLEFAVTHTCNSNCKHCSAAGNRRSGCIDSHLAVQAVHEVSRQCKLESLMTFGGEPLLFPETVFAIHQAAKECGVKQRDIITNGCLRGDSERIAQVAQQLCQSGVTCVLLSVDAFHAEHLSLQRQHLFAKALLDAGIPEVMLHPAWLVGEEADNPYNREIRRCLESFSDLPIPISSGNVVFPSGNAKKYLADYFPPEPSKEEKDRAMHEFRCGQAPYTSRLDELDCLSIEPDGEVMACAFPIGNLNQKPMSQILNDFRPNEDPYMSCLIHGSVADLCRYAVQEGMDPNLIQHDTPCAACYAVAMWRKNRQ